MAEKGIVYRLGWALYWVCVCLAVFWLGICLVATWQDMEAGKELGPSTGYGLLWLGMLPVLLAYGLGRFFRYVLAGE